MVYWNRGKVNVYWMNLLKERWSRVMPMERIMILPMVWTAAIQTSSICINKLCVQVEWDNYLRLHTIADVVLDPYPYGGGVSSC